MAEQRDPVSDQDSLDAVELTMAIEQAFDEARIFEHLDDLHRKLLLDKIRARIAHGEFPDWDDLDDDALGALVRARGPRKPQGQAGAKVKPEEPFFE